MEPIPKTWLEAKGPFVFIPRCVPACWPSGIHNNMRYPRIPTLFFLIYHRDLVSSIAYLMSPTWSLFLGPPRGKLTLRFHPLICFSLLALRKPQDYHVSLHSHPFSLIYHLDLASSII